MITSLGLLIFFSQGWLGRVRYFLEVNLDGFKISLMLGPHHIIFGPILPFRQS